jgi:hypothetical protein
MGVLVRTLAATAAISCLASAQTRFLFATAMSPIVQNNQADEEGLARIANDAMLNRLVKTNTLLPVAEQASGYYLNAIPAKYRYLRPWTRRFLNDTATQYRAKFGHQLRVTSLVRTESFQVRLAGYNTNAAPASGPYRSSHLTGSTLDISKHDMSAAEQAWMRQRLLDLRAKDKAYGFEERIQPTFHIMVFKSYGVGAKPVLRATRTKVAASAKPAKRARRLRSA